MTRIKKAQGGSYITTRSGKVGRTYGLYGPYESMDTTGYSKGKKEFDLNYSLPGFQKTSTKIKREDVPAKIEEFKKGATRNVKLKTGGSAAKDGKWIQKAIKKPGALRKQLGAKPGKPIPASKLTAAAKKPGKLGQRARLAKTLSKMRKKQ
jgi:hypothetical protein